MEVLGLSLPAFSQHLQKLEGIYDENGHLQPRCCQVDVLRTLGFYMTFTYAKKTQVLQRLSTLSVSASGHHPANPLTGLHIHNLMIWDDDLLISDPARLISSVSISMWCSRTHCKHWPCATII